VATRSAPQAGPAIERLPDTDQTIPLCLNEVLRGEHFVFTINGNTMESVPPVNVPLGALRLLDLVNESDRDHPFRLHHHREAQSAMRLVARFDEPGRWMCHCHILDHGEHGMMGEIVVK